MKSVLGSFIFLLEIYFGSMKFSPAYFGVVSAAITALFIICLPLPHWMAVVGQKDVGAFQQETHSSSKYYSVECIEEMSQTECGYLKSMQVSAVLTVLFGVFATIVYFLPPRNTTAVPLFLASSGSVGQLILSIMTLVIFAYFQQNYFDDDGINQEYTQPDETVLSVVYYLWLAGTVVLGLSTGLSYYVIHASTYTSRKGMLTLND